MDRRVAVLLTCSPQHPGSLAEAVRKVAQATVHMDGGNMAVIYWDLTSSGDFAMVSEDAYTEGLEQDGGTPQCHGT